MSHKPEQAFILAAGKGTRLRPYTDHTPKPMVEINGKPILQYTVEKLKKHGIGHVVINLFHLKEKITDYFSTDSIIQFSEETELLETGCGVKKALGLLQKTPFYLINGDALWSDEGGVNALKTLDNAWQADKMDILLLLKNINDLTDAQAVGDYDMNTDGRLTRSLDQTGQYMFTGIRITSPCVFDDTPEGAFSFLHCMDAAEENKRLYGVVFDGDYHHISTPDDVTSVSNILKETDA